MNINGNSARRKQAKQNNGAFNLPIQSRFHPSSPCEMRSIIISRNSLLAVATSPLDWRTKESSAGSCGPRAQVDQTEIRKNHADFSDSDSLRAPCRQY